MIQGGGHTSAAAFAGLAAMWFGMMAVMMAPTAWPWMQAFDRFGPAGQAPRARVAAALPFAGGYLAAWLPYSVAAAALQVALSWWSGPAVHAGVSPGLGSALLVGAGLYQFAPLKHACLSHCRSPFSYFLTRWRDGAAGGFRMGLGHGFFCVGCCWALMLTALAAGMANAWWMAALAAAAFAEQVLPWGPGLRKPLGVALVGAGVLRLL